MFIALITHWFLTVVFDIFFPSPFTINVLTETCTAFNRGFFGSTTEIHNISYDEPFVGQIINRYGWLLYLFEFDSQPSTTKQMLIPISIIHIYALDTKITKKKKRIDAHDKNLNIVPIRNPGDSLTLIFPVL